MAEASSSVVTTERYACIACCWWLVPRIDDQSRHHSTAPLPRGSAGTSASAPAVLFCSFLFPSIPFHSSRARRGISAPSCGKVRDLRFSRTSLAFSGVFSASSMYSIQPIFRSLGSTSSNSSAGRCEILPRATAPSCGIVPRGCRRDAISRIAIHAPRWAAPFG